MTISSDVKMVGNGRVIFDGDGSTRLFRVDEDAALRLVNLTLQNGGGTVGAAIEASGVSTITASVFNRDTAGSGGAIENAGALYVSSSTLYGNSALRGGAMNDYLQQYVEIDLSTFIDDSATLGSGGAIWTNATGFNVTNSTLVGNTAATSGGAIWNAAIGNIRIVHSTMTDNHATRGGAIHTHSATLQALCHRSLPRTPQRAVRIAVVAGALPKGSI